MKVYCFSDTLLNANMYLVFCNVGCFVIDPCAEPSYVESVFINSRSDDYLVYEDDDLIPEFKFDGIVAVIATHGHFDHICCLRQWQELTKADFYIHEGDAEGVFSDQINCSSEFGMPLTFEIPRERIRDIMLLSEMPGSKNYMNILYTPGHSKGSCLIIMNDKLVFTGDTLFAGSAGRTDLYGGDSISMGKSMRRIADLFEKKDILSIFPGHGPSSVSVIELNYNPFLK